MEIARALNLYQLSLTNLQVDQLTLITGGHPYLVSEACKYLSGDRHWSEFKQIAATNASPYGNHLRQLLRILQRNLELGKAFSEVISEDRAITLPSEVSFKLLSLGLVKAIKDSQENSNDLYYVQNNLYRQYFLNHINELRQ